MDDGSLYYAVAENDAARLEVLLEQGGNVDEFYEDTMNISSKSLLHVCCGKGHVECLKHNQEDFTSDARTRLHGKDPEILLSRLLQHAWVLIQHGAQLDVRDKWGQTPLMYSITIQFPEIVKVLLDADAGLVSCQDRYGKAPLHCAIEAGSEELVCLLLQYGADINIRCHDGMTPLMMCCTSDSDGSKAALMKVLLAAGALVDLKDFRGKRTALHVASASGNVQAVETLIAAGTDINEIDKTLRTPLTLAVFAGVRGMEVKDNFMNIISLLVSAGADVNVNVCESCNPLMASALLKSETAVRYFLSMGADPNIKFPSGVTPALVASSTGDLQTLNALISYNSDLTMKGSVYKRRKKVEYTLDAFELAYIEGHLNLCVLMAKAGYRLHGKTQLFMNDLQFMTSGPASTNPSQLSLALASSENIPADYRRILDWLVQVGSNPRSLTEEAIFAVRACLGRHLATGIHTLPLPSSVKRSVLLSHLLT